MLDYFASKKVKTKKPPKERQNSLPLLTDEDEEFLRKITHQVEGSPPPLPERPQDLPVAGDTEGNNAQLVVFDQGARNVPLPDVPDTPKETVSSPKETLKSPTESMKKKRWSFFKFDSKSKDRKAAANNLESAIADSKAAEASGLQPQGVPAREANKEADEIEQVLEQLNMAAVNNQVFSISDESRELLRKFTLVFKDLVNGVPTAYHDLEALITNSESQLQKMWLGLPPFMQQLIKKLPTKFGASLGPEVLAAAAEKPGKADIFTKGANAASKAGVKIKVPNLKDLIGKKGALVGIFRTILNSLRARFPAVLGLNVLWSLAIAVLLLVCWYCHKRGKEARLEKEREVTEAEMEEIRRAVQADPPAEWSEPMTTLAPAGASINEIRESLAPASSRPTSGLEYAEGGSLAKALKEEEEQNKQFKKPENS